MIRTWISTLKLYNGALRKSRSSTLVISGHLEKSTSDGRKSLDSHRRLAHTRGPDIPMEQHEAAVRQISTAVSQFYKAGQKFRISHGSTNSTRSPSTKGQTVVDTSRLKNVLKVDTTNLTALVEPNVSMDRLVEETLKYDLIPPVVMEFPGITVGGGYAGTSGESSSFKHGFFDRTINQVEMVLGNGEVVNCSRRERPDLFHGAAGAVGTLGVTTSVELQLRKAKKYVEATYHPVSGMRHAIEKLQEVTSDPDVDYIDGILFTKTQGVIIAGRLTDESQPDMPIQTFSDASDPWFYLHVQDRVARSKEPVKESIPLAEYLFRYDRGGFWVGASPFDYFHFPFNKFTRWWLDDFLHTRMMYTALHASGHSRRYVVQDLALPYETAEEFVEYTDRAFGIYPLWLCPLRQSPSPTMHPHLSANDDDKGEGKQMLNIGLWGKGPWQHEEFVKLNRDLEDELRRLGGMKWLYAHTYYKEDEFWVMYNRKWHDGLRDKYHATSLPSVYEKVKVDIEPESRTGSYFSLNNLLGIWPFSGLFGIKKAIESGTYLEARAATWRSRKA